MLFTRFSSTLFLLLCLATAGAQADSAAGRPFHKNRLRFSNISEAGFVAGESLPALQLQTVNGLGFRRWFAGAGAGLDYYRERTFIAFLDFRTYQLGAQGPLFLYGDIGMSVPWVKKDDRNPWVTSRYQNGLYYDAGLGYRFLLKKQSAVLINAGYSVKGYSEDRYFSNPCLVPPCPQNKEQFAYRYSRIAIRAGFQF